MLPSNVPYQRRKHDIYSPMTYGKKTVLVGRNQRGMYVMAAPAQLNYDCASCDQGEGSSPEGESSTNKQNYKATTSEGSGIVEVIYEGNVNELDTLVCALGEYNTNNDINNLPWLLNSHDTIEVINVF